MMTNVCMYQIEFVNDIDKYAELKSKEGITNDEYMF